jgi:hypothetical protein
MPAGGATFSFFLHCHEGGSAGVAAETGIAKLTLRPFVFLFFPFFSSFLSFYSFLFIANRSVPLSDEAVTAAEGLDPRLQGTCLASCRRTKAGACHYDRTVIVTAGGT